MQTLYTVEDKETGSIKTELHVSSYSAIGLIVVIYRSDEYGNHIRTVRKTFMNTIDVAYHTTLRKKIKAEGGIIHKKISDTPLPKTKITKRELKRDMLGRFCKN